MKYIVTCLLFFITSLLNAQNFSTYQAINYENQTLSFNNHFGDVTFVSGGILYFSNVTEQLMVYNCSPMVFEIMNTVVDEISKIERERTHELEIRVLFYEKYFGKLEGDVDDDCIIWVPVKNPPYFDNCVETKD